MGKTVLEGRDGFGNEIEDEDRLLDLGKLFEPSASAQARKVGSALLNDVDKHGDPIDKLDVLSRQAGFRISEQRPEDLKKTLKQLRIKMASARKDLKRAIIKANKNKQLGATERAEQKADAREKFNSLRDRIRQRMEEVEGAPEKAKR